MGNKLALRLTVSYKQQAQFHFSAKLHIWSLEKMQANHIGLHS